MLNLHHRPSVINVFVEGIPGLIQCRGKKKAGWQRKVRSAVSSVHIPGAQPLASEVAVRLLHFCYSPGPDLDNILKPTLDALIGIAYVDDAQIMDIEARRFVFETPLWAEYLHEVRYTEKPGVLIQVFERY